MKPINLFKSNTLTAGSVLFLFLFGYQLQAQTAKYLNPKLSTEERVDDLVSKLTFEQKIKLLQYRGTPVKTKDLNIPAYNWWNESLHGVARAGRATVFPQAIGLAASWDAPFIQVVANAISDEARAKYEHFAKRDKRGMYQGLNFWTPNINIFRDPRWGRGMETYGEDPYLTGKIASSFIRGLQGNNPKYFKTIATVKHFAVHSGPESSRHRFNANVSDRDFYQTYTPAFKTTIQEAGAYSLMCAYNRFRDKPCCGSDFLLTDLLRNQWGFKGFIVTDCGAVDDFFKANTHQVVKTAEEACAIAIKAGVDLECGDIFNALDKAVEQKLVTEQELDVAIKRLFTARFKLGLFDKASAVPYANIPYSVVESPAHKKLALEAARKSIVLLKNSNQTLPLKKTYKTIAVIGPNAYNDEVMLANYNGFPSHVVTPLEGIRKKLPAAKILYAKGSLHADGLPSVEDIRSRYFYRDAQGKQRGLSATYFADTGFKKALFSKIDTGINFNWIDNKPDPKMDEEDFSVSWSGYLKSPVSGEVSFSIFGASQYELILNGKSIIRFSSIYSPGDKDAKVTLKQGEMYKIEVKYASFGPNSQIRLGWELPGQDLKKEALRIASQAEAVIMCMGLSPRIEGEEMNVKLEGFSGGDRTALKLPEVQLNLIKEIKALGKPVILVLVNGSALAINWEKENIPAIVETWYGGQEGGTAIADVLFGDYNPAGKLPVTFYTSENELPDFENYDMKGRTYRYYKGEPLFPFGHGLSYTNFTYSNLNTNTSYKVNTPVSVSVEIQNTGSCDGEDVVQLYLKSDGNTVEGPLRSLKGFQRVSLKKGEKKTLTFLLKPDDFSVITDEGKTIIEPGQYEISLGGGQPLRSSKPTGNGNIVTKVIYLTGDQVRL